MLLEEFSVKQDVVPILVFDTKIVYDYFEASLTIEDFWCSFREFKNELIDFYDGKRDSANLVLTERKLEVSISKEDMQMICKIQLNHYKYDNTICHSSLIIYYEIDQSFLPELINEINETLDLLCLK